MTKPRISIIGMGLIGASIGLALQASDREIHLVGHDIETGRGRLALKKGALDASKVNLIDACQDADLVVLAIPINQIRQALQAIAPHLKPGCVVTDTATLKAPVQAWAEQILPPESPFVGGDPVLSPTAPIDPTGGLEAAQADLFMGALYCLTPSPDVAPTAVKRVSDMVDLIQARPFYLDPAEHDGLRAAVDGLPTVLALALTHTVINSSSWREGRKIADCAFSQVTLPVTGSAEALQAIALLNRQHLLPWLDAYLSELGRLRDLISGETATPDNGDALHKIISETLSARARWIQDRELGDWEDSMAKPEMPSSSEVLRQKLGLGGHSSV